MKRDPALQSLSREHHQTLVVAQRCLRTAKQGDAKAIATLCRQVAELCRDWETHFQAEERELFPICLRLGGEAERLAKQLAEEHHELRRFCDYLRMGDAAALQGFGALLQQHTRTEERQLFPLLEASLDSVALARLGVALAA